MGYSYLVGSRELHDLDFQAKNLGVQSRQFIRVLGGLFLHTRRGLFLFAFVGASFRGLEPALCNTLSIFPRKQIQGDF